jgi:hypothetical protein
MSGTLPPLQKLSPDNQGPIVVVVAYILVSLTILFTTIRVITFHTLKRGFGLDDAYLSFAAVRVAPPSKMRVGQLIMSLEQAMALIQTVLTQRAVDEGLGRPMKQLETEQIESYYKACDFCSGQFWSSDAKYYF